MDRDIKDLISHMTLEEKVSLCSGLDFWHTKPVERLGIPSIMMTDGPHGLRKQSQEADHLGLNKSVPATCFPSGAALASSWNRELVKQVGVTLGEECQAENVSLILGPAANIKRSPLCGRNFEYFSEDPYLSSEMAKSHINGVQSQGIGTSLKHFAVNNQEHRRLSVDAVLDQRTLREIYLASFEGAVKEAQPWTVMCSYNKVNGTYASEHELLLTSILKEEWGHEGFVVSDWGAVNDRVSGLMAGLELEMPSSNGLGDRKIVDAVQVGRLSEKVLDLAVERLLHIIYKAIDHKKENARYDKEAHHKLARQVASECMVLLKNEEEILPLKKDTHIAVIGAFACAPRYQGGGSSHINPTKLDIVYEEIKKIAGAQATVTYEQGFVLDSDNCDENMLSKARIAAKKADVAVIFAGLPDRYESEGYDREHLRMPENQVNLIQEISKVQSNVVVVLSNGSPIEMPWIDNVKAVLEGYLGGQASGGAIADLLFGEVNPSGKLAETFPKDLRHNPSYLNFPGEKDRVAYQEGLFVGYRYYDKKGIAPLFPFGYGLSYTTFAYTSIAVNKKSLSDKEILEVSVKVKNTGKAVGKEVIQLYVRDTESTVIKPEKELKAFEKVALVPGEETCVTFQLDQRAFAYYNTELEDWHVESGEYEVLVGSSSIDITLKEVVTIQSSVVIKKRFTRNSTFGDIMVHPEGEKLAKKILREMFGEADTTETVGTDMSTMMKDFVLRSMVAFSGESFTEEMLEELLNQLNA